MKVFIAILALSVMAPFLVSSLAHADDEAKIIRVNAPGGAYIQCDPRNPQSPIRCTPDGW